MVSRRSGPLNKMVLSALKGKKGVKWSHVMSYLEKNSFASDSREEEMAFESPFPSYTIPNDDLRRELWYDSKGDSLLRLALKGAPSRIIAALCHFCPEVLASADPNGRLPLHSACRYTVSEVGDKIIRILVQAFPESVIARDNGGRTPLHYLFWYHAPERKPEIINIFCQTLPKTKFFKIKQEQSGDRRYPLPEIPRPAATTKIPSNAAIVMDGKHGCLPLHYAVMQGAQTSSIAALLQAYPAGKHQGDRYGRTALHWYLGAELLQENPTHVSGEALPPSYENWWETVLDVSVLEQITSSRVVRTADSLGRFPLHWACHLIGLNLFHNRQKTLHEFQQVLSVEAAKMIADPHIGQIGQIDSESKTPLMVFMDTFGENQKAYWLEHKSTGTPFDPQMGGPLPFSPPPGMIDLLLKHPDESSTTNPAEIEDTTGRLPIHAALEIASSEEVIEALIEAHPTCLLHTTENALSSPLHSAFLWEHIAPLQTTTVIGLLLNPYSAGRHGYFLDGRLAMKMEDGEGNHPIHLACSNHACLNVVRLLVEKYPKATMLQRANFDLPMHCVLDEDIISYLISPHDVPPPDNVEERIHFIRSKLKLLAGNLTHDQVKLQVAGRKLGLLPLHVVVLFQALDYKMILRMLTLFPESGSAFTADTIHSLSALDMHELAKERWQGTDDSWQRCRELLFSFGPTLESHRHREELLDSCVRIVINEMSGVGSYHSSVCDEVKGGPPELDLVQSLSSLEETSANFPRRSPARIMRELRPTTVKEKFQRLTVKEKRLPPPPPPPSHSAKSKYDEEEAGLFDYDPTFTSGSFEDEDDDSDGSYSSDAGSEDDDFSSSSSVSSASAEESLSSGSQSGSRTTTNAGTRTESEMSSSFDQSTFTSDSSAIEGATTFETRASGIGTLDSIDEDGLLSAPIHSKSSLQSVEQVFEKAKRLAEEEKKDDERLETKTPPVSNTRDLKSPNFMAMRSTEYMSEVGLRLWTFFVLYCDRNNPGDNYVRQVGDIFDELGFSTVEKLVAIPLPAYSSLYLSESFSQEQLDNLSFEEVASPKCRELIRKTCFFVSRFEFLHEDSLVYCSSDRSTVVVQAFDWTFTTEETKDKAKPGMSEAEIWSTGEVPAEVGTTFKSKKSLVWIKFSMNSVAYESEVDLYSKLKMGGETKQILPILCHFNGSSNKRKEDRCFRVDTHDARFRELRVFKETKPTGSPSIQLSDFLYATVYKAPSDTLASFHQKYGVECTDDIRSTCRQIAISLKALHDFGFCHGNLTMDSIALSTADDDKALDGKQSWLLTNLESGASMLAENSCYVAKVGSDGKPLYTTQTLPPEAFTTLSPPQQKLYEQYWQQVENAYGVPIDATVFEQLQDTEKGEYCVVKNYYEPSASHANMPSPALPYELEPTRTNCDVWAFGQLLFHLCVGRDLCATNKRSMKLLDAGNHLRWGKDKVSSIVYSEVVDPLAQDLLLLLLGDKETRHEVTFDRILDHPFFNETSSKAGTLADMRKAESAAYQRSQQLVQDGERELASLKKRSVPMVIWDLGILKLFYNSPTEVTAAMSASKKNYTIPCSYMLLPYDAMSEEMEDTAIQFGEKLLTLNKACILAGKVKNVVSRDPSVKWSSSELLKQLVLPLVGFEDLQSAFLETASKHVESFREDPLMIAYMLVQTYLQDLYLLFEDQTAYLHLVDEFTGSLLGTEVPYAIPTSRKAEVLKRSVLAMYLTCNFSRGKSTNIEGLVGLFFSGNKRGTPAAWVKAAAGLEHNFSREVTAFELEILQEALSRLHASKHRIGDDDIQYLHSLLVDLDSSMSLQNIRRVVTSEMCLWVSTDSVAQLESLAGKITLGDML